MQKEKSVWLVSDLHSTSLTLPFFPILLWSFFSFEYFFKRTKTWNLFQLVSYSVSISMWEWSWFIYLFILCSWHAPAQREDKVISSITKYAHACDFQILKPKQNPQISLFYSSAYCDLIPFLEMGHVWETTSSRNYSPSLPSNPFYSMLLPGVTSTCKIMPQPRFGIVY